MTFTAIDFETATIPSLFGGIVTVENGVIVDEFVSLIKPKQSVFSLYNSSAWDLSKGYDECKTFRKYFLKSKTTTGSNCSSSQ
jgi:AAA+ ATPase superfamily predicted ATPase